MDFAPSARAAELTTAVREFIDGEIMPVERAVLAHHDELLGARAGTTAELWQVPSGLDALKTKARAAGLWNLFLPDPALGGGLSNSEYAPLAEQMGRSLFAPTVFNCNAPDSGNMEVLHRYGSQEQKEVWLEPLLEGDIRSAFCMTEPDVASSDATNMAATAVIDGDEVVINGRKWWSTGVGHPDCKVIIFMGLTDPNAHRYARHSMVLVPVDTPGVTIERMLPTMGFYDEPGGHGVVSFEDVRLPVDAFIAGPGKGFEIAQGRLGPGRVHHAMRLIGLAEVALEHACRRGLDRTAFGKPLVNLGGNRERIADARIAINQTRGYWCCMRRGCWTPWASWARCRRFPRSRSLPPTWPSRSLIWQSKSTAAEDFPMISRWRLLGSTRGRCGWPMAPTRCIGAWSPASNWRNTLASDGECVAHAAMQARAHQQAERDREDRHARVQQRGEIGMTCRGHLTDIHKTERPRYQAPKGGQ